MSVSSQKKQFPIISPQKEAGIGLRGPHYRDLLEQKPDIGWIEVHPENYFGGGLHRHFLTEARALYPLSFHAVGMSLGSDHAVNEGHLASIKELINIYEPFHVSDHASWSASGNAHLNDLLPLPYTEETVQRLCDNVDRVQNYFGRQILVENPSSYVSFTTDEMSESDFMNEIAKRTNCGILLDVNNIYVQSVNHNFDPYQYMDDIEITPVKEMHLAGHIEREYTSESGEKTKLLIDTHNQNICAEVWDLYQYAIKRFGAVKTLIEWDTDLPPLEELTGEALKAQTIINENKNDSQRHARAV